MKFFILLLTAVLLNTNLYSAKKYNFSYNISTDKNYIYIKNKKFIVKGISYNPYYPGERNGDIPRKANFEKDIKQIKSLNINTITLYWLRPIKIYKLCRKYNIKVIQGVVAPNYADFQDRKYKRRVKNSIRYAVDFINKNNLGDVILLYWIGGEFDPMDVKNTDRLHKEMNKYIPKYYKKPDRDLSPAENFLLEAADYLRSYELKKYKTTHIVSHINWPYADDVLNTDFMDIAMFDVYSHWPALVANFEPRGSISDTHYQGYIEDLKSRYPSTPVLVSEFGYSTAPEDDLASVSESEQAEKIVARWCDIATSKFPLAGGNIFEWNDEWWKQGNGAKRVMNDYLTHEKDDYEEWYGIIKIDGKSYKDYTVRPKKVYKYIKFIFSNKFNPVRYLKKIKKGGGSAN